MIQSFLLIFRPIIIMEPKFNDILWYNLTIFKIIINLLDLSPTNLGQTFILDHPSYEMFLLLGKLLVKELWWLLIMIQSNTI